MRTSGLLAALLSVLVAAGVARGAAPITPDVLPTDPAPPSSALLASSPEPARTVPLPVRSAHRLYALPPAADGERLAAAQRRRRTDPPELVRAPGTSVPVGQGPLRRYAVEVEAASGVAPDVFAAEVDAILADPRSWSAEYRLQRVTHGRVHLTITLATPDSADALCWPLDTRGTQSCWNDGRAVLNAFRWEHGATTYGTDLAAYRAYLVNHEVGHGVGRGHLACPGAGRTAPVMLQQTLSLDGCLPGPWPFPEGSGLREAHGEPRTGARFHGLRPSGGVR